MHTDPTHVIELLVVLEHLDSARYLSETLFDFNATLCCADYQSLPAFCSLHTNMVYEHPRDNRVCDVINDLVSITDS